MDNIKIFENPQFGEIRTMWTMSGHRFIRDLMTKTEEV